MVAFTTALKKETYNMKDQFRLDRTHSEVLSFEEADRQINDHSDLDWKERFRLHQYLNSIAYGYVDGEPPKMDKSIFSAGKQGHG